MWWATATATTPRLELVAASLPPLLPPFLPPPTSPSPSPRRPTPQHSQWITQDTDTIAAAAIDSAWSDGLIFLS